MQALLPRGFNVGDAFRGESADESFDGFQALIEGNRRMHDFLIKTIEGGARADPDLRKVV